MKEFKIEGLDLDEGLKHGFDVSDKSLTVLTPEKLNEVGFKEMLFVSKNTRLFGHSTNSAFVKDDGKNHFLMFQVKIYGSGFKTLRFFRVKKSDQLIMTESEEKMKEFDVSRSNIRKEALDKISVLSKQIADLENEALAQIESLGKSLSD